jgi:small conductance mechanosensitive channel
MNPEDITKYTDRGIELLMGYLPKVVLAIVTLLIGLWLVGKIAWLVRRSLEKRKVDETLIPFLVSVVSWIMRAAVLISVASLVGIETTSFIAVLGAAGLAVGLALQGSLSNFAGGALILIFRPFRIGDVIEALGQIGSVREISIFTTTLTSGQNRRIILPNGPLANGTIINYTVEGTLRMDLVIGVSYDCDLNQAQKVLMDVLEQDEDILEDPTPMVEVLELADNSVNLAVRPHTKSADYWKVYFRVMKKIKLELDKAGIGIPYPQRDVHLYEHKSA